ncbi:uncharacterized protein LOC141629551 [Silene latifolia]|uniref:uncharacterized protein LOC141629551 n=1 Tax=Silene latifolia TaxID=37657 RepID=UPI003D77F360
MIGDIKDHNGTFHSGMQGVGKAFVENYQQLLGNSIQVSPIDPAVISAEDCVNPDDHAALIQPVTRAEIKQALFAVDSNKSPGIDGFSIGFFKKAWDIVGDYFSLAVEDFFKTGSLPKQANTTLVSLIPKKPFSQSVKDFRPISCCSTIYKTISKILIARLQRILPTIVGHEQAAFVQGRSLFENVMLTQGLHKGYGRKNFTSRCMLKVDISNAFDTLQWSFLNNMLSGKNFPPAFIKWIIACVTSSWFTLNVNGAYHGFFKGKSANLEKTEVYFGGVKPAVRDLIVNVVGIKEGSFPFRYLGYPINASKLTVDMYDGLLLNIQDLIGTYSVQHLSYAGRIQSICVPWEEGGFQIKEVAAWNKAAMLKWLWQLDKIHRAIWTHWVSKYYLEHCSIWDIAIKECFSESLRGIILTRNECIEQLGSAQAAKDLLHDCTIKTHFSVRKAYDSIRCRYPVTTVYKAIQRSTILPRHKVTLMLAVQGKLPTQDLLINCGFYIVNRCYMCKSDAEYATHLFFSLALMLLLFCNSSKHGYG